MSEPTRPLAVVMGVSGTGKSTIGVEVAQRLRLPYADADSFHPPENKAKMEAGEPLDDDDRYPWLEAIGEWLAEHADSGGVISCSALKRKYRDQLRRHTSRAQFIHLSGDRELITRRISGRTGHFMPKALLGSQLATLEPLAPDEAGTVVDVGEPLEVVVDQVVGYLRGAD